MGQISGKELDGLIKDSARYLKKNPPTPEKPTVYGVKRGPIERALIFTGAATFLGLSAAGAAVLINKANGTEAAKDAKSKLGLCSDCAVTVDSGFPLPTKQDTSINQAGGIEYSLSGTGVAKSLKTGEGAGLQIDVEAKATDSYDDLLVSTRTPAAEVTAEGWFDGINNLALAGGEVGEFATALCFQELDILIGAVQENPETFATEDFPAAMLREMSQVYHASQLAPSTDVPVPAGFRREIVFVSEGSTLVCPGKRPVNG